MGGSPSDTHAGAPDCAALANRLRKNGRHWGKWARRNGIGC
jgi:hypothetical protein